MPVTLEDGRRVLPSTLLRDDYDRCRSALRNRILDEVGERPFSSLWLRLLSLVKIPHAKVREVLGISPLNLNRSGISSESPNLPL
jgi:hypothetical protein